MPAARPNTAFGLSASRAASRYLAGLELLAHYRHARPQLKFAADWLAANRGEDGTWDMGQAANDKVYFPLSDDWRRRETRAADCTERIGNLLTRLTLETCCDAAAKKEEF